MAQHTKALRHILDTFPEWQLTTDVYGSGRVSSPKPRAQHGRSDRYGYYNESPNGWTIATGSAMSHSRDRWKRAQRSLKDMCKRVLAYDHKFAEGDNPYTSDPNRRYRDNRVHSNKRLDWLTCQLGGSTRVDKSASGYRARWTTCDRRVTIIPGPFAKTRKAARRALANLITSRAKAYLAPWYDFS